jgi:steroid delta-isomerase-like uncharacterized protein
MEAEDAKGMVRRRFEELDAGNVGILDEMFTDDYVLDFPGDAPPLDLERTKRFYAMLYAAFPDLKHSIEDQIAEGDKVVTRWIARGTHRGELLGIAPTEKRVTLRGINIYRIAGDKLAQSHVSWDIHGLMQQLDATQAPAFPGDAPAAAS